MRLSIEIDDELFETVHTEGRNTPLSLSALVLDSVKDGKELQDTCTVVKEVERDSDKEENITNGEIFQKAFPEFEIKISGDTVTAERYNPYNKLQFSWEWWITSREGSDAQSKGLDETIRKFIGIKDGNYHWLSDEMCERAIKSLDGWRRLKSSIDTLNRVIASDGEGGFQTYVGLKGVEETINGFIWDILRRQSDGRSEE